MPKQSVLVDEDRCVRLGEFLRTLKLPNPRTDDVPGDLAPSDLRMFYFIVVAVCHQTSPLGKARLEGMVNGQFLFGWDYLRAAFLRAAKADPIILTPGWLVSIEASDIVYILYDHELKQGSNINDPKGRAGLLRDIGARMLGDGVRHVDEYYSRSCGLVRGRGTVPGLEEILTRFEAYGKDPVKKKLTYFLMLMDRYGLWTYHDTNNLGAPVDYHEMRLHLRLGTVKVVDAALKQKIMDGIVLKSAEDVAVRLAVYNAIFKTAEVSGADPPDLHYFFWNVARNCCRRDETHCGNCGSHSSLPKNILSLILEGRCLFSVHCVSSELEHHDKYKEPIVDTDLY